MFVFWSASSSGFGNSAAHDYKVLPWHQSTTGYPKHWPPDVGHYWVEARRSIEGKNWTAAALMARSAVQLVVRAHGAKGKNLKEEIDDLAARALILPIMKEWAHEVRELGNEGTHPQPGTTGTNEKDAKDVVEFLSFLMTVMYNLPNRLKSTGKEKVESVGLVILRTAGGIKECTRPKSGAKVGPAGVLETPPALFEAASIAFPVVPPPRFAPEAAELQSFVGAASEPELALAVGTSLHDTCLALYSMARTAILTWPRSNGGRSTRAVSALRGRSSR
jgi:hypothetical protein